MVMKKRLQCMILTALSLCVLQVSAQDNYEIQVYGAQTMTKGSTMFELHSNYIGLGTKDIKNGVYPTNHIVHETLEITHGFTDNFEIGFYMFNALGDNGRSAYVGSHIRPRIAAPQAWHLPVGLSFSAEVGYQKSQFSEDDWTMELRPIIDKTFDKLYLSFNPTFDRSLHGLNKKDGFVFSPNFKASYAVSSVFSPGLEYYGSLGPLNNFSPANQQNQQLFLSLDVDFSPVWELNLGYGFGLTDATDKSIYKMILGRRIDWHHKKS
jgi:hypothetical protein